jgi:uncharacterized protein
MMEMFPVNIALGKAFCNRDKERHLLKQYVQYGRHVVLVAPRRYGKTSLINQTLLEMKLPYTMIELTMATSLSEVEQIVVRQIGKLLYHILPRTTKAKQNILKLFKWLNPELVLTVGGQKIIFHPERKQLNTVDNLAEILRKLDDAAGLVKKQVVVVMDEFQQLCEIKKHAIEASIRHAMQYSKHVVYLFSGSNRHMLLSMFNDKNRPFYNSCEMMSLDRITVESYEPFIQQAARKKWRKLIPGNVLNEIFKISELHPSYINRICGYFWLVNKMPNINGIKHYWLNFVESKRAEFAEDILSLSKNQRRVLNHLAKHPTSQPSNHEVCNVVGLSEASVRQAVRKLMLKDYIYKDKQKIVRLLDPALRDFICLC